METTRDDRKKTFRKAVDDSRNEIVNELLFTAINTFFYRHEYK